MNNYHNTIPVSGMTLQACKKKASDQQSLILAYFESHQGKMFTPFQVCAAVFNDSVPITSVRRAITNLTEAKLLIKCQSTTKERYGAENHFWTLKSCPQERQEIPSKESIPAVPPQQSIT